MVVVLWLWCCGCGLWCEVVVAVVVSMRHVSFCDLCVCEHFLALRAVSESAACHDVGTWQAQQKLRACVTKLDVDGAGLRAHA